MVIHEHERRDLNSVLALELRQLRTHDVPHVQNRKVEELAVIGTCGDVVVVMAGSFDRFSWHGDSLMKRISS